LLNFFGLGGETLAFVADRSTYKQGRLTPGTHIPIVAPERLVEQMPITRFFSLGILRKKFSPNKRSTGTGRPVYPPDTKGEDCLIFVFSVVK